QVTLELRRAIVCGDMGQGDPLRETALAEQLGVSRVPVREALIELERHGLVEFDDKGRTRVPVLTAKDLEEIYQLRLALEPLAARLMAERAEAGVMIKMEQNIADTRRAKSLPELAHLDAEFHDLLAQGSGNRRLQQSWEVLRYQVELWLNHMQKRHLVATRSTREDTVTAHLLLLRMIRTGDPEKAGQAMHEHIVSWRLMLSPQGEPRMNVPA
ncbi:MAG: transcriptional regulator, GntR family, partial [Verrucomicrobiaceae bacterium]|nr:transcriptional regulator, GntR family [Verrucomicrobiaceae bacterium]